MVSGGAAAPPILFGFPLQEISQKSLGTRRKNPVFHGNPPGQQHGIENREKHRDRPIAEYERQKRDLNDDQIGRAHV